MRKIYSFITLLILLLSVSLSGQDRIYAPELRAPEDGQTNQYPNVLLDWDAVTGQTNDITYEVQVATKMDFSDAITLDRTRLTAIQTEDLPFGQKFYWRVMAFDAAEPSEWSETWGFQIAVTVNMSSPNDGTMVYADPEIEWDSIDGLTKYQMQVDTVYDWSTETTGSSDNVSGTFVISKTNMWSVGAKGTILHFDGTDWMTSESGVSKDLNSIYFIDEMNGYAVGEDGTVLHYNGSSWETVDAGTSEELFGVSFADANTGWAVGASGVIVKYNSGSWSAETSDITSDLYGVYALSTDNVWVCGKSKIIAHYNGSAWSSSEVGTKDHFSVWFVDANNGWVVGKTGEILYFNGNDWVAQISGTNRDLYGVSLTGSEGYAVGKTGTMLYYNGAWTASASGTKNAMNGIWLANGTGLAGGDKGDMLAETGEGFSSPYVHTINVPGDSASWELHDLLYGSIIYYRMRAIHSSDTSAWSGAKSMETYAAPELKTPKNNSGNTDLLLLFKWDEYPGSNDYYFEIDDDESLPEPFMIVSDSISANFTMKKFGADYYWRVRASHALDISEWSEVWSLTTANTVELISPADQATDITTCPRYIWEIIEGVPEYEIMISTDEGFPDSKSQIVETPFFQCNEPLDKKTMYYWKVKAITSIDSSDWSETRSFETEGFTAIEDEFTKNSIDIYPNPATNDVSISIYSFVNDVYQLNIVDITGKLVYEKEMACNRGDNKLELSLSDFQKGMYFVSIRKKEKVVTKKLIIR